MRKVQKRIPVLDRLAEEMLVLSEAEQSMYIAGTFYYDYNGNFLGTVGSDNDVKVGNSVADSGAISLSSATEETLGKVLTTMGRSIGISGDVVIYSGSDNTELGTEYRGQVSFNYNGMFKSNNNYYEYLAVLHHEHSHQMTYQSGSGISKQENECRALQYQISQRAFKNTSDYFKSLILKEYYASNSCSGSSGTLDAEWAYYTYDEYLDLLQAGEWKGGYVEEKGYKPAVTESGSGTGSSGSGSGDYGSSGSGDYGSSGSYGSSGNYGY